MKIFTPDFKLVFIVLMLSVGAVATSRGISLFGLGALVSLNSIDIGATIYACTAGFQTWTAAFLGLSYPVKAVATCLIAAVYTMVVGGASAVVADKLTGSVVSKRTYYDHDKYGIIYELGSPVGNFSLYNLTEGSFYNPRYRNHFNNYSGLHLFAISHNSTLEQLGVDHSLFFVGKHASGYSTLFGGNNDVDGLYDKIIAHNTSGLVKRATEVEIDWISYSYEDGQIGDATIADTRHSYAEYLDQDLASEQWLLDNWKSEKMCMAGFGEESKTEFGGTESSDEKAFFSKGEIYINQYGGIDSFCDNSCDDMDQC